MKRVAPLLATIFLTAASALFVQAQDDPAPPPPPSEEQAAPADEQPDQAPPGEQPADQAPSGEQPAEAGKGDSDLKLGKGTATVERETNRALRDKVPLRVKAKGGEQVPLWTQDTVLLGEDSQAIAEFGGSKVTLMDHTTFRVKSVGAETSICEILGIELELERGTELEASFGSLALSVNQGNVSARNTGSTGQTLRLSWTDVSGNTYSASVDFPPAPAGGGGGAELQVAPGGAVSVPAGSPPVSISVSVTPPGGGQPVSVSLSVAPGQSLGEAAGLPAGSSLDGLGGAIQEKAGAGDSDSGSGSGGDDAGGDDAGGDDAGGDDAGGDDAGGGDAGGGDAGGDDAGGDDAGGDDAGGDDAGGDDAGGGDAGGGDAGGGDAGGNQQPVNPLEATTTQNGSNDPVAGTTVNNNNPGQATQQDPGSGVRPASGGL